MVKRSYLCFLGVLIAICLLFFTQLTATEGDFQVVDSIQYARVVVGALFLAVSALFVKELLAFRRQRRARLPVDPPSAPAQAEERAGRRSFYKLIAATGVVLVFYCSLFTVIGFYTTGFLATFGYMVMLYLAQNGRVTLRSLLLILGITAGVIAALYLVFSVAFELWLPKGILL